MSYVTSTMYRSGRRRSRLRSPEAGGTGADGAALTTKSLSCRARMRVSPACASPDGPRARYRVLQKPYFLIRARCLGVQAQCGRPHVLEAQVLASRAVHRPPRSYRSMSMLAGGHCPVRSCATFLVHGRVVEHCCTEVGPYAESRNRPKRCGRSDQIGTAVVPLTPPASRLLSTADCPSSHRRRSPRRAVPGPRTSQSWAPPHPGPWRRSSP